MNVLCWCPFVLLFGIPLFVMKTDSEKLKLSIFMRKTIDYPCHCETIILKSDGSMSKLLTRRKDENFIVRYTKVNKVQKIPYKTLIVRIEPEVLESLIIKVFYCYHFYYSFLLLFLSFLLSFYYYFYYSHCFCIKDFISQTIIDHEKFLRRASHKLLLNSKLLLR